MKDKKDQAKNQSINNEEKVLISSALQASSKAMRSSLALGLTVKVIEDDQIVALTPTGKSFIRARVKSQEDLSKLTKGMVLKKK